MLNIQCVIRHLTSQSTGRLTAAGDRHVRNHLESNNMEPTIECPNCSNVYPRRRLHCPFCDQIGILKLYKYLSFNEHSLSLIINKEIWCPKAKTLNDPFEFHFHLTDTNIGGIPINQSSLEETKEDIKELSVVCRI